MTTTKTFARITAGAIAAAAMLFATMPGGAAHADGRMSSANNLKQIGLALHDFDGDGDVDGRDFLIWQRSSPPAPAHIGVGELQEVTISKSMDTSSAASGGYADWQSNYGTTGH